MKSTVPPTRQNLLKLASDTRRVREGINILKSKREALLHAFLSEIGRRALKYDDLEKACRTGAEVLADALSLHRRAALQSYGASLRRDGGIEVEREKVWGVPVATFDPKAMRRTATTRGLSKSAGVEVEEAARTFEGVLEIILESATLEARINRLGNEIQKTSRRISSLETRLLPAMTAERKVIHEKLSEMERDQSLRFKHIRDRQRALNPQHS